MAGTQDILAWLLADAEADLSDATEPVDRAYVPHNAPAVDFEVCSQLTVHLVSVTPRPLATNARVTEDCGYVRQGRIAYQVWRCAPAGSGASAEDLGAASAAALADAEAIERGITARRRAGTLLPPGPRAKTAYVSTTPLGPTGASAGWQILLDIELSRAG